MGWTGTAPSPAGPADTSALAARVDALEADGQHTQGLIAALTTLTGDLRPPEESTGWATAASDEAGGIGRPRGTVDFAGLRAANDWAITYITHSEADFVPGIRIPKGALPANYRMRRDPGESTEFIYTSQFFRLVGTRGKWDYYLLTGGIISADSLILEVTGDASHIGTSAYHGLLEIGQVYEQARAIHKAGAGINRATDNDAHAITWSAPSSLRAAATDTIQLPTIMDPALRATAEKGTDNMNWIQTQGRKLANMFAHAFVAMLAVNIPADIFNWEADQQALIGATTAGLVAVAHAVAAVLEQVKAPTDG